MGGVTRARHRLPSTSSTATCRSSSALVLALSFILLLLAFRSVVVAVTAIAHEPAVGGRRLRRPHARLPGGLGRRLFGLQARWTAIESWVPLLMFCVLFGLSMDYQVFLLSRIRERWIETHDSDGSVVFGVQSTAGIITGAALIMVAVFIGMGSGQLVVLQEFGVGLAIAVLPGRLRGARDRRAGGDRPARRPVLAHAALARMAAAHRHRARGGRTGGPSRPPAASSWTAARRRRRAEEVAGADTDAGRTPGKGGGRRRRRRADARPHPRRDPRRGRRPPHHARRRGVEPERPGDARRLRQRRLALSLLRRQAGDPRGAHRAQPRAAWRAPAPGSRRICPPTNRSSRSVSPTSTTPGSTPANARCSSRPRPRAPPISSRSAAG